MSSGGISDLPFDVESERELPAWELCVVGRRDDTHAPKGLAVVLYLQDFVKPEDSGTLKLLKNHLCLVVCHFSSVD